MCQTVNKQSGDNVKTVKPRTFTMTSVRRDIHLGPEIEGVYYSERIVFSTCSLCRASRILHECFCALNIFVIVSHRLGEQSKFVVRDDFALRVPYKQSHL